MSTPELILAIPGEIVDNEIHAGIIDECRDAAGSMIQDDRKQSVWGTADKALMAGLIERSQGGDLEAMESIYEMFKRPVFSLAYRHTMNRVVAEDLLQDIFLKIFSHFKDVRDPDTFPAWVFRIALNTCHSHLRQKRVQSGRDVSMTDVEDAIVDENAAPVERDLREPLNQAIQSLSPRLKDVFVLHDVQGYKHEEIARLLGCSAGTSKSQLFKARMKLRAYLKDRDIA